MFQITPGKRTIFLQIVFQFCEQMGPVAYLEPDPHKISHTTINRFAPEDALLSIHTVQHVMILRDPKNAKQNICLPLMTGTFA